MVDHINNGEEGYSVRGKLNTVIDRTNDLMGIEDQVEANKNLSQDNKDRLDQHDIDLDGKQPVGDYVTEGPKDGDLYGRKDGGWFRVSLATVSDNLPQGPAEGDLWLDTQHTMELYVYIDGSGWVSVTGAGTGGGGALPDNIVTEDDDPDHIGKLLGRITDPGGDSSWRPIYTSDIVTMDSEPVFRTPDGRFASRLDPAAITNQQHANWYLLERFEEAGIPVDIQPNEPIRKMDGDLWFNNTEEVMQLFAWQADSEAWVSVAPPTTLEDRVVSGEATQQAIIDQIQESLAEQENIKRQILTYQIGTDKVMRAGEPSIELVDSDDNYTNVKFKGLSGIATSSDLQSIIIDGSSLNESIETLADKVSALEGAVGDHSFIFDSVNQNPRTGQFIIRDDNGFNTSTLSSGAMINFDLQDRDGKDVDWDRVRSGDVLRLSDFAGQVAELRVTQVMAAGAYKYELLYGTLDRLSEYPYDFVLLSSFDPAGLATIAYVDERDETKLSLTGGALTGNLSTNSKFVSTHTSGISFECRPNNSQTLAINADGSIESKFNLQSGGSPRFLTPKKYVDDTVAGNFIATLEALNTAVDSASTIQDIKEAIKKVCEERLAWFEQCRQEECK